MTQDTRTASRQVPSSAMSRLDIQGQQLYYRERAHVKWLIRHEAPLAGVLLIILIFVSQQWLPDSFSGWKQFLAVFVILFILSYLAIREYWKWQNWVREFNAANDQGTIHRPGNAWLIVRNHVPAVVKLSEVTISDSSKQDPLEQVLMRRSSTLTLDSEALLDQAFHNMRDFLDAPRVVEIVQWCLGQEQRRAIQQAEAAIDMREGIRDLLIEQRRTNTLLEALLKQSGGSMVQTGRRIELDDTQEMSPVILTDG